MMYYVHAHIPSYPHCLFVCGQNENGSMLSPCVLIAEAYNEPTARHIINVLTATGCTEVYGVPFDGGVLTPSMRKAMSLT